MTTKMPFGFRSSRSVSLLLVVLFASARVVGAEASAKTSDQHPEAESVPVAAHGETSGLRAFYDPVTGTYSATGETQQVEALTKALQQALSRSTEGLETFTLEHGGHGVHLEGGFQSAAVAFINDQGVLEFRCTHDHGSVVAPVVQVDPKPFFEDM